MDNNEITLTKVDYILLKLLYEHNHTTKLSSADIKTIMNYDKELPTLNSLHLRFKDLESLGYVHQGLRTTKAFTFYITPEGIEAKLELES